MLRGDYCIRKDLRSPYIVSMPSRLPRGKRSWKIFSFMCRKIVANPPPLCIITPVLTKPCALVAELVDALDSGSSGGSPVKVRVLSGAPNKAVQVNCLHGLTGFLRIAVSIQNGIRCGKTGHFFANDGSGAARKAAPAGNERGAPQYCLAVNREIKIPCSPLNVFSFPLPLFYSSCARLLRPGVRRRRLRTSPRSRGRR